MLSAGTRPGANTVGPGRHRDTRREVPVVSRSDDQLAGCWHSLWHSTRQHRAGFGDTCWTTHPT
jgi:hypothetical protein